MDPKNTEIPVESRTEIACFADFMMKHMQNPVSVKDDGVYTHLATRDVAGNICLRTIRNKPVPRPVRETLSNVDSLAAWILSEQIKPEEAILMVNSEGIYLDGAYSSVDPERVSKMKVPFLPAPEFVALQRLVNGVDQKALWRSLITDLSGCFPGDLLIAISGIATKVKDFGENTIDLSGIASGGKTYSISVESKNAVQTAAIPLEWVYTGRVFSTIENTYSITLRLELDVTDKGLFFKFNPIRLDLVTDAAIRDCKEALLALLPEEWSVRVYLGKFISY